MEDPFKGGLTFLSLFLRHYTANSLNGLLQETVTSLTDKKWFRISVIINRISARRTSLYDGHIRFSL